MLWRRPPLIGGLERPTGHEQQRAPRPPLNLLDSPSLERHHPVMLDWWRRLWDHTKTDVPAHLVKGERGEQAAACYLRQRDYKILTSRFHGKHGEIDLVARDGEVLAFVEVKTRGSDRYGAAADAVNREKQQHLASCAREYLRLLGNPRIPIRFDVVEVYMDEAGMAGEVRLIQGAFTTRQPLSD